MSFIRTMGVLGFVIAIAVASISMTGCQEKEDVVETERKPRNEVQLNEKDSSAAMTPDLSNIDP